MRYFPQEDTGFNVKPTVRINLHIVYQHNDGLLSEIKYYYYYYK